MGTLPSLPKAAIITGRGVSYTPGADRYLDMAEADMTETFQGRVIAGRGDAESIAIQVLNFIVADVDRIIQFLNITGLQPETIRESATSSHFLLGVLEYVAKDDELLKAIDQELKIRPAAILVAFVHLSPEPETRPLDKERRSMQPLNCRDATCSTEGKGLLTRRCQVDEEASRSGKPGLEC